MRYQLLRVIAFATLLALQPFARAQNLLIDDFSTGPDSRSLTTGIDTSAYQTGAMLGGDRWIVLYASGGPFEAVPRHNQKSQETGVSLDSGFDFLGDALNRSALVRGSTSCFQRVQLNSRQSSPIKSWNGRQN